MFLEDRVLCLAVCLEVMYGFWSQTAGVKSHAGLAFYLPYDMSMLLDFF